MKLRDVFYETLFKLKKKTTIIIKIKENDDEVHEMVDWCNSNVGKRRQHWEIVYYFHIIGGNNVTYTYGDSIYHVVVSFLDKDVATLFALKFS